MSPPEEPSKGFPPRAAAPAPALRSSLPGVVTGATHGYHAALQSRPHLVVIPCPESGLRATGKRVLLGIQEVNPPTWIRSQAGDIIRVRHPSGHKSAIPSSPPAIPIPATHTVRRPMRISTSQNSPSTSGRGQGIPIAPGSNSGPRVPGVTPPLCGEGGGPGSGPRWVAVLRTRFRWW